MHCNCAMPSIGGPSAGNFTYKSLSCPLPWRKGRLQICHRDRPVLSRGDRQQCLPRQPGGSRRVRLQTSDQSIGVAKALMYETCFCLWLLIKSRAPLQDEACLHRSLLIDLIAELPDRVLEEVLQFPPLAAANDACSSTWSSRAFT